MKKKSAFTIIELTISLIVIGILVMGGSRILKSVSLANKALETSTYIKFNTLSLIDYSSRLNTLPDEDGFDNLVEYKIDKFGNPIYYEYDETLTTDNICKIKSTDLKIEKDGEIKENIAYVISSNGKNNKKEIVKDGDTIKLLGDDLYEVVSFEELRGRINCEANQINIINTSIVDAKQGSSYTSYIYTDIDKSYFKFKTNEELNSIEFSCDGEVLSSDTYSTNECEGLKISSDDVSDDVNSYKITITVKDEYGNKNEKSFAFNIGY